MQANISPIAVSALEASRLLSIDRATFYRRIYPYVLSGQIQSITIGRARRILTASLLAWVQQQAQYTSGSAHSL